MKPVRVGIINVTGYMGAEVARLLFCHPAVQLASVTGRSAAGQQLVKVFPHLPFDLTITNDLGEVDLVFSAMSHKVSAEAVVPVLNKGIKVVDLSADFRLKDPADYPEWYDFVHPAPHLLKEAVFGLPELYRSSIRMANLVANPGCYPTSAILALAPAVKAGLISSDIIIDSKSGVSGAGRTLSLTTHYAEAADSVSAYSLNGHRHTPEIIQELVNLKGLSGRPKLTFVPHLIPMSRGILSSCYGTLIRQGIPSNEKGKKILMDLYLDFYRGEPFVRICEDPPQTKHTWGSNYCHIYPTIDVRNGRLVVISCLDNLVKGGAGQAIQNMNIMLGIDEMTGLRAPAIYP